MVSALVLAAAAAQSAIFVQAPTVPPPILAVGTPRMSSRIASDVVGVPEMTPVTAIPVHVRVMAGNQQLFNDSLRVTTNAGASYQESRSEAPTTVCAGDRYYSSQQRYSINLNLYLREGSPQGPMVNVSVTWQRPSAMPSCGGEGSRQVQLTQTVPLAPGQSVTIQGDAGLAVTISR
jgi:hypothetical protein